MTRIPVSSSRMRSVGWEDNVLEIEFHNGQVYQYFNVSYSEYNSFINSSSLGHELSILDKKHPYKPVR